MANRLLTETAQVLVASKAAGTEFENIKLLSDVDKWLSVER
jgi:hypothetical protein